jgi:hypothetical protein
MNYMYKILVIMLNYKLQSLYNIIFVENLHLLQEFRWQRNQKMYVVSYYTK